MSLDLSDNTINLQLTINVPPQPEEEPDNIPSTWNGRICTWLRNHEESIIKWLKVALVAFLAATALALVALMNGEEFTAATFAVRIVTGTGSLLATIVAWKILHMTWDNKKSSLPKKLLISALALAITGAILASSSLSYASIFGLHPTWSSSSYWKLMANSSIGLGITFAFSRAMKQLKVRLPQAPIIMSRRFNPVQPGLEF